MHAHITSLFISYPVITHVIHIRHLHFNILTYYFVVFFQCYPVSGGWLVALEFVLVINGHLLFPCCRLYVAMISTYCHCSVTSRFQRQHCARATRISSSLYHVNHTCRPLCTPSSTLPTSASAHEQGQCIHVPMGPVLG